VFCYFPCFLNSLFVLKNYSAQEQGRQRAQEENERRMIELPDELEREHQKAWRDAQEQLDRQRLEKEKRESEQKEEARLRQLKLELLNYDFHTCPRIKKEAFQNLEVDDVDLIRIALIGPTGSGKTSLVGKSGCFSYYHLILFIYLFIYLLIFLFIYLFVFK